MSDIESIKARIAKLLAMSRDSSSPNEAAIAAGRARKLMDQHQIEEFMLTGKAVTEDFATVGATHFSLQMPTYMQTLSVAIANYNDCHARFESGWMARDKRDIVKPKRGQRIVFNGYRNDAELAADMYARLLEAVSKLGKDYMLSVSSKSTNVLHSFKLGAVNEIIRRIDKLIEERDREAQEAVTGRELMIVKRSAVDEHFGEVNYKASKAKKNMRFDAMIAGTAAGRSVEILHAIEE